MTTQSNVQGLLESGVGLQNTAQSGVPSGVNNGNPNTPYNWATYIPSILNGANGQPASVNFNPITASVPNMSAYGNQTPFTPDPFMAMLLSQLRAPTRTGTGGVPGYGGGGNSMINNILANMLRGPATSTTPPAGGTTTPPVTTPPGTTPGTGTPIPGAGGTPVVGGNNEGSGVPFNSGTPIANGSSGAMIGNGGSQQGGGSSNSTYSPTFGVNIGNSPSQYPNSGYDTFAPNPVGSGFDFSTSPLTGSNSSTGNWFTRLADQLGLVPSSSSPGGFWSDVIASGAESLGINGTMDPNTPNTFNPAQAAAGILGGPAGSAAYNAIMGPSTSNSNNLGGIVTTGPNAGFGIPGMEGADQGNWNINETYIPPNFDFSNTNVNNPTAGDPNFDPVAYLEAQRQAEANGTAAPQAPTAGTTPEPVNAQGRTAAEEAAYRAQLDFQSNLAAQRYGQDIGFVNPSARAPRDK